MKRIGAALIAAFVMLGAAPASHAQVVAIDYHHRYHRHWHHHDRGRFFHDDRRYRY